MANVLNEEVTNQNEINQNLEQITSQKELVTEKEQIHFLDTTLGKLVNTAIDLGLRWILPDFVENQIIDVKESLLRGGLKEGIDKAINSAVELGKNVTGILIPESVVMKFYRNFYRKI